MNLLNDFYPEPFTPKWYNAEECPACKQLGMCIWQESSTARKCQCCGYIEERYIKEKEIQENK